MSTQSLDASIDLPTVAAAAATVVRCVPAETDEQLEQILALQTRNLERNLLPDEAREQGFVTCRHDLATLRAFAEHGRSVVAVAGDRVVGYVLFMAPACRHLTPVLEPLFQLLDGLALRDGRALCKLRYYLVGQVCVDKQFRGQGLVPAMYAQHRQRYSARYDCCVTEIAERNQRSLRAHEKVGFHVIHRFTDPQSSEQWVVVAWDWQPPRAPSK